MSMLVEPKCKLQWSLNPRGNLWVNDNQKFGQKMLEKMGWCEGKGLGKHEDGIRENIKASYKNDSKGIGWNDSDGNWITHQDDFNAILSNLNKNLPETIQSSEKCSKPSESCISSEVSLEMRSKCFKNRVHYRKFVRGKDVSQYNEQDMESIFGAKLGLKYSKSKGCCPEESIEDDEASSKSGNRLGDNSVSFHGQTYTSNTSISDYFASKMKKSSLLNQGVACKKICATGICKEKSKEVDEVSDFENTEKKLVTKKDKEVVYQTTRENFLSPSKEKHKSIPAIHVCPSVSYETLPTESSQKKRYKMQSSSEKMFCTKRLKTYHNKLDKTSSLKAIKSCLKDTLTNAFEKNITSVRFSDEHFLSSPESIVSITKCNDTEYLECGHEDHIAPVEMESQCSAYALSPGISHVEFSSFSRNEVPGSLEHRKRPHEWSNDNSWSISEKLALKMNYYRSVLCRKSEHVIFSTTNLLEIKGYGNW